jgi:hypothetical protein
MKQEQHDDGKIKRRGPRIVGPFKGRWCGALIVPLVVHDLSIGGCLILSSNTSLPSGRMTLEIDLPGGDCVRVQAEPLHIRRNIGFAVRFVDVPDAVDMRLQRLMRELAATGNKQRRPT